MKTSAGGMRLMLAGLTGLALSRVAAGAVVASGDVDPDPSVGILVFGQRLAVGEDELGTVRIDGGTVLETNSGTLGRDPGGRGEVTITGTGSTWDAAFSISPASMTIGRDGEGLIAVLAGGKLISGHGRIAAELTGSGEVRLDGMGTAWENLGVSVGERSLGILSVTGGAVVTSDGAGRIGDDAEGVGEVMLSGAGSSWTSTTFLAVGDDGEGTLEILGGASVENTFASVGFGGEAVGAVTVDGEDSTWTNSDSLRIGAGGMGNMEVTGGGRVKSVQFATVGSLPGASGMVTVAGMESAWEHDGDMSVGDSGSGELHIAMGGRVTNAQGSVGFAPGGVGVVTVDGENSLWSNSGDLYVGNIGDGTLGVTNGGRVEAGNVVIGLDGPGEVELSGRDSFFEVRDNMALGGVPDDPPGTIPTGFAEGTGRMTITERARVDVGGQAILGAAPRSEGILTVTARGRFDAEEGLTLGLGEASRGELTVDGHDSRIELDGDLHVATGVDSEALVTLSDGGTLDMEGNDILVGPGSFVLDMADDGELRDVGRFGADLDQQGGLLGAGNSPGMMVIGGDYTLGENAILELEVAASGGVAGVDFDYYVVEGEARLRGVVRVRGDGGFSLARTASFDFLTASSIELDGLTLDGPAGAALGVFDSGEGGEVLRLTLVPEPTSGMLLVLGGIALMRRSRGG